MTPGRRTMPKPMARSLRDCLDDVVALATIARWLGPWADTTKAPNSIEQHDEVVPGSRDQRPIRVRVYRPRRPPRATFMIAPGLHYEGADDVRQDRFCRVLAAAGHLVLAPVLQDFIDLQPSSRVIDDFQRVWAARGTWDPCERPPVVFSISFGSLPACGLASRVGDGVERLVLFGGYADMPATLRYCLFGRHDIIDGHAHITRDPLNQPVVFMSFLPYLDPPCENPDAVRAAWRQVVVRTWGRPEMKAIERYSQVALDIAKAVPENVRELYLHGVGMTPNWLQFATDAAAKAAPIQAALDVVPYLDGVHCQVDIVHGRTDDVIPVEQAEVLARGMTNADVRVHLTGLYSHTGGTLPSPSQAVGEVKSLFQMLSALARA